MQDVRPAEFVRWVSDDEPLDLVVNEARADTWRLQREHALLEVQTGGRRTLALIVGGRDGIELRLSDKGRPTLVVEGAELEVTLLAWHTHPIPTGPSDQDREVLRRLGQHESRVFEPRGERDGIRFFGHTKGGEP